MSQVPARNPVLLAGIVLAFVGILGGGTYALNGVVNPPPPSPSPQPRAVLPAALVKCPAAPVPRDPIARPTRTFTAAPAMNLEPGSGYCAYIRTARGTISVRLRPEVTPIAVNNFVFLARDGFYDGIPFHRVCPNPADSTCSATFHIAQAGNPTGKATGSAAIGYTIPDEPVVGDYTTGTLGMANTGAAHTAASQFFINTGPNLSLQKKYQIFGYITGGMDVAQALVQGDVIEVIDIATDGAAAPAVSPAASPEASPSASAVPAASPSP